jgi:hypothetical protein
MLKNMFKKLFAGKQTKNIKEELTPTLDANNSSVLADCLETSDLNLPSEQILEHGFFSWLFACDESEFTKELGNIEEKEASLLQFIDDNLFDVDKLPRQPASLPMLIKLLNDENSTNGQISKALLSDPALTAQILITANTPFFARTSEPVTSIDQAVLSLGRIGIRNIVSASIMMPMMKNRKGQDNDLTRRIWEWGMISALACDQYAIDESKDAGLYYLLGLLLPLSYLLIHNALEGYAHEENETIDPLLSKTLLMSQSWKLCQELCEQWGLPVGEEVSSRQAKEVSILQLKLALEPGIFLSMYSVLDNQGDSPISLEELGILTQKPAALDSRILKLATTSQA